LPAECSAQYSSRCPREAHGPEIRFHDLRHTYATLALANGVPIRVVSDTMGHSPPSVTIDMYRDREQFVVTGKLDLAPKPRGAAWVRFFDPNSLSIGDERGLRAGSPRRDAPTPDKMAGA
jgi:hypothetical protein